MPMLERKTSMYFDREQKVTKIKRELRRGDYRVDPHLVADAIVHRLAVLAALNMLQNECSYPLSSSSASLNTTVPAPSTTRPTSVAPLARAVSSAGPGMQAHSS
jgi:Anti-sigma-28 factor, FlgM